MNCQKLSSFRVLTAAAVAAAMAAAILAALLTLPSEPSYEGKPLSVFLLDWSHPPGTGTNLMAITQYARERQAGEEAVRNLGPKAVPMLVRMLRKRETFLGVRAMHYGWGQFLSKMPILKACLEPARPKNRTAAQALGILGPSAKEAVPALIEAVERNPDEKTRFWAAVSLGRIGPDAVASVPALKRVLGGDSDLVQGAAREALRSIGPPRTGL